MPAHRRLGFGHVERLPSGRWRARFRGPDRRRHAAPLTFDTRTDARAWLSRTHAQILDGTWLSPAAHLAAQAPALATYAKTWLDDRDLKARTRYSYGQLLDRHILPILGDLPLTSVTPTVVRAWYAKLDRKTPTQRAHAYALLKTIMATAVTEDILTANPCRIRGAGAVDRKVQIRPASLDELTAIVEAIPARYKCMVLLAAWCALRFGELVALTRADVDRTNGIVKVRRQVVRIGGAQQLDTPKTASGIRDVRIPPHLLPVVVDHVEQHAQPGRAGLLFPPAHGDRWMQPSTLYKVFYPARKAAGLPDLRFHDLRHTGAVLAAQTGATLAELMARLGHSSPQAAMRYQHASADRDLVIAQRLSELASAQKNASEG